MATQEITVVAICARFLVAPIEGKRDAEGQVLQAAIVPDRPTRV